jgi:hypothetical protein
MRDGVGSGVGNTLDAPPPHAMMSLWVNPVATIETNYVGEKTVSWSWGADCVYGQCSGAAGLPMLTGYLDGTYAPIGTIATFLATLDDAERAELLRFDPLHDPPGRSPESFASDPRLVFLGNASVGSPMSIAPPTAWMPCVGTLTDDDFPVFASHEVPFGSGETLVIQHSTMSGSASCALLQPGLGLATTTPGCDITAAVYVDRAFGTLVFVRTSVSPACTTAP